MLLLHVRRYRSNHADSSAIGEVNDVYWVHILKA